MSERRHAERVVGRVDRFLGHLSRRHSLLNVATANSLCPRSRLRALRVLAAAVARKRIDGDVVECGVYRGGSALVLADRLLRGDGSRAMWLFDTFGGMPEPGPEDPAEAWKEVGTCTSSEAIVRETFRSAGAPLGRVHFVVGLYAATLPRFVPPPIALLHLDCDWHDSVRLCLETFYDAVVPGGLVVLDDYGHWTGCRTAVDRFLATRSFRGDLIPIDYTSHYFWKR